MNNNEGSEFIGGFLHNQTPAQPLDVFDLILQEVERTQIKAINTDLIFSWVAIRSIPGDQLTILGIRFRKVRVAFKWGDIGFILRPAR